MGMVVVPEEATACWLWQGVRLKNGYGKMSVGYPKDGNVKSCFVHRLAYEFFVGPIPAGLCVCHRCDVRHCVNPAHLFVGTQKQNMEDMVSKNRQRKLVTCKRGHRFEGANIGSCVLRNGKFMRWCAPCKKVREASRRRDRS